MERSDRERDLDGLFFRKHLPVGRITAFHKPAINHRSIRLEQHVVGPQTNANLLLRIDQVAFKQLHGLGRHDMRLPLGIVAALDGGRSFHDGQPAAVGGH